MLKRLDPTVRDLLMIELLYALPAMIAGILLTEHPIGYAVGILLGYLLVCFLVCHMFLSLEKTLSLDGERASKYGVRSSILRYAVTAVCVLGTGKLSFTCAVAMLVMLFGLKLSAYLQPRLGQYISKIFKEGR